MNRNGKPSRVHQQLSVTAPRFSLALAHERTDICERIERFAGYLEQPFNLSPMARPKPAFNKTASAILIEIYENPQMPHSRAQLAQVFSRTTNPGQHVLRKVSVGIEELIVHGLVRGTRLRSVRGVYYANLKLTRKGQKAAIRERRKRIGS